ncbi:hypothetical protein PAXRUDRAFT_8621 [Paxillus rubicundulus Ve08.2h10]|uniref:Uncharacterized protein n=1 Tax=Paxillus rubicundulus Ve08.2h10 TaxID=930991 RepID=A0A0D0DWR5_9AGAM|nr:hypothetical protein PAXRUDRAFT_8621 [Paxillus rubicundulus Ve08.2h10]
MGLKVEFPHSKIGLPDLPETYFHITPVNCNFTLLLQNAGRSLEKVCISQFQLPIQPDFAVTGHSAQVLKS